MTNGIDAQVTRRQRGTYLGFSSQIEINFLEKNHVQIRDFVRTPFTEEQIQKLAEYFQKEWFKCDIQAILQNL